MAGALGGKKQKRAAAQAQAAAAKAEKAAQKRAAALDEEIKRLKAPTAMPDETGEAARRARYAAAAAQAEKGVSEENTSLTGSRLGDSSTALARRGRIKSAVMSGGA
jgi:hypothetical protein